MLKVKLNEPPFKIKLDDYIFSIGSCFSDEVSKRLELSGLKILSNPFGVLYNTFSILNTFQRIIDKYIYKEKDINENNGIFFSYEHSGLFNSSDKNKTISSINKAVIKSFDFIRKAEVFIITLGTSAVYRLIDNDYIIANCHKQQLNSFKKDFLSVEFNTLCLNSMIRLILSINQKSKIILTLSPVRHLKNDLTINCISKSVLRVAIENVIDNKNIFYFPSYEIVYDELRNYSFYKRDHVHLKDKAIDVIYKKFTNIFFNSELIIFTEKLNKLELNLNHKPFKKRSANYFDFLKRTYFELYDLYKINSSSAVQINILRCLIKIFINFYQNTETGLFFKENLVEFEYKYFFIDAFDFFNKRRFSEKYPDNLKPSENDIKLIKCFKKKLFNYYIFQKYKGKV